MRPTCTACDAPLSAEDVEWMSKWPEPDGDVFCEGCLLDVNPASAHLRGLEC